MKYLILLLSTILCISLQAQDETTIIEINGQTLMTRSIVEQESIQLNLSMYQGLNIIQFVHDNGTVDFYKVLITE